MIKKANDRTPPKAGATVCRATDSVKRYLNPAPWLVFLGVAMVFLGGCRKMFDLPEEKEFLSPNINYDTQILEPILGRTSLMANINSDNSTLPLQFEIVNARYGDGRPVTDLFQTRPTYVWIGAYDGYETSLAEIEAKRRIEERPLFEVRESGQFIMWASANNDLIEPRPTDSHGTVQRGYLGIEIRSVNAADASRFGLDKIAGIVVTRVADQGAASRAGIRSEDIVLAVDDFEIDATSHFQSIIAQRRPGDTVNLSVWRRGAVREFEAQLIGRDDEAFQAWAPRPSTTRPRQMPDDAIHQPPYRESEQWGFGFRDLTTEEQQLHGLRHGGIYVLYVREGSPAAADGLPVNAVIAEIEGQAVRSAVWAADVLERFARAGQSTLLRVQRSDGQTAFYDLEPAPPAG